MKTKNILISGYYGFDNFGDDAILHTLLHNLRTNFKNCQITVISKNPAKIKQDYDVNSVYTFDYKEIIKQMKSTDLYISGGGSLLQDITSIKSLFYYLALIFLAELFKIKTCIYAQGIGPIKSKLGKILTGIILKKVDLITVRDQQSKEFLDKLGIKSYLTADPVWNIDLKNMNKSNLVLNTEKRKVGIQLRDWYLLNNEKLEYLVEAINLNFDDNYQLILISLQDSHDLEVTKKFNEILKLKNPNFDIHLASNLSISSSISLISQLDYIIAMRYHASLIAIKSSIPTLAISYDPKVEILSKEAEIPYIFIENLNKEELNKKICELIEKKSSYEDKLRDFSAKKELESRQNVDLLSKMLVDKKIVKG
ncbi:MAG: polysaccharide pyruvyl transferase CsaB [Candidatus Melainabacteria bacterium RIFOXYA2_FULL_32_9]|nr:MAG: polysaccharide pyruvyl transferase CsaB [Candidatus Melainabacteria bacterium RIFOXYA2_FULL_32_9]